MMHEFDDPFKIAENLQDIYILGGGVSNDLFFDHDEGRDLTREKGIIITCNGSISQVVPHYQICGDPHAVVYWKDHKNNHRDVIWIAKPKVDLYVKHGINHIRHEDLFNGKYVGTGYEAFAIAYYIQKYYDIKNIYYVGFDFSDLILPKKSRAVNATPDKAVGHVMRQRIEDMRDRHKYGYPNRGEVMPYQKSLKAPKNWWQREYKISPSQVTVYKTHLQAITLLLMDDRFSDKLRCRSFVDVSHANYHKPNLGYENAVKKAYYK